jgi:tetratricopeptide (TPR) repeat protein
MIRTRMRVSPLARRLARRLVVPGVLAAAVWAASFWGRFAAGVATVAAIALVALLYLVLPRLAHRAFERGDHRRAELLYRAVRVFLADPQTRAALDVSVAGCLVARGGLVSIERALVELGRVDPETLGVAARAAWYNNRAYALARGGRTAHPTTMADSLALIDRAVQLRPDVAGFRHTRGVVLLALGRVDDAIAELEEVWRCLAGDDAPPLLEAERCYDLGVAWRQKGEIDYARDYFQRAKLVAPRSSWAAKAASALA